MAKMSSEEAARRAAERNARDREKRRKRKEMWDKYPEDIGVEVKYRGEWMPQGKVREMKRDRLVRLVVIGVVAGALVLWYILG